MRIKSNGIIKDLKSKSASELLASGGRVRRAKPFLSQKQIINIITYVTEKSEKSLNSMYLVSQEMVYIGL